MRQLTKIILTILILLGFCKPGYSSSIEHRVVFMGNSITEGWGVIYPAFFEGKPYINSGIGGQTTSQMLGRFQRDVLNYLPTVVVILAGTNDIAGNGGATTVKNIHANIASMAQLAKTNGSKVVLCSVLPVYRYPWSQSVNPIDSISSLNSLLEAYAQENDMIYADYYSSMVDEQKGLKSQYSSDGVHPNLAGYMVMEPIAEEAIDKAKKLAGIDPSVTPGDVTDITVSPTKISLDKNDIKQLYARLTPLNALSDITWSSSNEEVATVSSTGLMIAKGGGTATISVHSANNNKIATCEVTVIDNGYTKFEAENATLNGINVVTDQAGYSGTGFVASFGDPGDYVQFTVTGVEAGRHDIIVRYATETGCPLKLIVNGVLVEQINLKNTGSWGSWTNHVSYATLTAGTNTIRYEKPSGGTQLNMDYISLTVETPIAVTGVEVTPGTADIILGRTKQLTSTVSPENAGNKNVVWTSSNIAVAEVTSSGLVAALDLGTATITATTIDGKFTSTCDVTVIKDPTGNYTVSYSKGNNDNAPSVSNDDLLQTSLSSRLQDGGFGSEGSRGPDVLTNGNVNIGYQQNTSAISSNAYLTYILDTSTDNELELGYSITGIDVYTHWGDGGRIRPKVTVSYSLVASPDNFVDLTTLAYTSTENSNTWTKSHVVATVENSYILTGVKAIKFTFGDQQNGYVGYSEIDVIGVPTILSGTENIKTNVSIYGANNNIVVDLSSQDGSSLITVIDTRGSVVKSVQSNGSGLLNINIPTKGIYMVLVQNGDKLSSKKVVLN